MTGLEALQGCRSRARLTAYPHAGNSSPQLILCLGLEGSWGRTSLVCMSPIRSGRRKALQEEKGGATGQGGPVAGNKGFWGGPSAKGTGLSPTPKPGSLSPSSVRGVRLGPRGGPCFLWVKELQESSPGKATFPIHHSIPQHSSTVGHFIIFGFLWPCCTPRLCPAKPHIGARETGFS